MSVSPLQPGSLAPEVTFSDEDGREFSTHDFRGRAYVLYFYPRDNTPGCTKEACGFRDAWAEFEHRGIPIVGVSPDKPATHRRFREKYDLPFYLASDPDYAFAKAYGVYGDKQFMGKTRQGVHRITFLVGSGGVISAVFQGVKAQDHAAKVLEALSEPVTPRHGQA